MTLDNETDMNIFNMMRIKYAMVLERHGMIHSSKRSAHALAKRMLGIKGNRDKVFKEFCEHLEMLKKQREDSQREVVKC